MNHTHRNNILYVWLDVVARSRDHCCSGNATSSACIVKIPVTANVTILSYTEIYVWRIFIAGKNEIYVGLHVKCLYIFRPILTTFGIPRQILIEVIDIKFRGYPSSGTRPDTWGRTDGYDEANRHYYYYCCYCYYYYVYTVRFYCLIFIIFTNKCTRTHTHTYTHTHIYIYIYIYIYIKTLNYITNSPTCFVASAPSSGGFDIAFVKVI